ncbi:hypothetical protein FQN57_001082 [Myotisia sp. PD_48]|nr:hypothetical protein FQN57_001082 [Myotisia sp. PD_48]
MDRFSNTSGASFDKHEIRRLLLLKKTKPPEVATWAFFLYNHSSRDRGQLFPITVNPGGFDKASMIKHEYVAVQELKNPGWKCDDIEFGHIISSYALCNIFTVAIQSHKSRDDDSDTLVKYVIQQLIEYFQNEEIPNKDRITGPSDVLYQLGPEDRKLLLFNPHAIFCGIEGEYNEGRQVRADSVDTSCPKSVTFQEPLENDFTDELNPQVARFLTAKEGGTEQAKNLTPKEKTQQRKAARTSARKKKKKRRAKRRG